MKSEAFSFEQMFKHSPKASKHKLYVVLKFLLQYPNSIQNQIRDMPPYVKTHTDFKFDIRFG